MNLKISCIILLVLLSCRPNKSTPETGYPAVIDSLQLQHLYDDVKWNLYLIHCDDTPNVGKYHKRLFEKPVTFGSFDLRLDSLEATKDSVKFYFDYYYGDTLVSCLNFVELNNWIIHGVACSKTNDSSAIFIFNCGTIGTIGNVLHKYISDTTVGRFVSPLQPDVIKFIKSNSKVLDPWFYDQAVKRGYLN